jgi:hypothetical protein
MGNILLFKDSIMAMVKEKVNSCKNLWEANIFCFSELPNIFGELSLFKNITWNNIKLPINFRNYAPSNTYLFIKGAKYNNPDKITRKPIGEIGYYKDSRIMINNCDIENIKVNHIKKLFEDNPNLKYLYLINPETDGLDNINRKINLDKMDPLYLSNYITAPLRKKSIITTTERNILYKLDSVFNIIAYSNIKADNKTKVLCLLDNQSKVIIVNNEKYPFYYINDILKNYNNEYSFYGINSSASEELISKFYKGFLSLSDFIENKILSKEEDYFKSWVLKYQSKYIDDHRYENIKDLNITNPNSLYLKRLRLRELIIEACDNYCSTLYQLFFNVKFTEEDILNFIKNNLDYNYQHITEEFYKKYPIMKFVCKYMVREYDNYSNKDISDYINMMDKENIDESKKAA